MKDASEKKRFSESTGKLHINCPYKEKSGVQVHVVIKGGYCYRSGQCMVLECKYHRLQSDIESLLSIMW
ncbi:MAG: hypothetical protein M0Z59_07385 [Nitrospiraceae bacterium]|nr:hypothetical protein [Nitrospiraceae bacterium]